MCSLMYWWQYTTNDSNLEEDARGMKNLLPEM